MQLLERIPESVASPRTIANTALEQLYHEWSMLSRASEQRLGADRPDAALGEKLRAAQSRLGEYLNRWKGAEKPYLSLRRAVVYFDKAYAISRSVYASDIPLISIPLTDFESDGRWHAMAHEAGHHLFWNALDLDATDVLHDRMRDLIATALSNRIPSHKAFAENFVPALERSLKRIMTWQSWIEEVFADVLGTLLAGPGYVVSAQELAAEQVGQLKDFASDDRDHPCPYLRPLICLETLRQMIRRATSKDLENLKIENLDVASWLEQRWKGFCADGAGQQMHRFSGVGVQELGEDVTPIIRHLLETRIWPKEKRLLDLVEFFGRRGVPDEERQMIAAIPVKQLPRNWATYSAGSPGQLEYLEEGDIPDSLKGLRSYLRRKFDAVKPQEGPVAFWHLLLTFGLSEDHHHETAHVYWDSHPHPIFGSWFGVRAHRHDLDTSEIIWRA
jgi:hypothetical protein